MENFVQKRSISRNLALTIFGISTFFLIEFAGLYISSQEVLDGLTSLNRINHLFEVLRQTKGLVQSIDDIFVSDPTQKLSPKRLSIVAVATGKIDELLRELDSELESFPEIKTFLEEVRKSIPEIHRVTRAAQTDVSPEPEILLGRHLTQEAIDNISQMQIALQQKSETIFSTVYESRFRPLIVGIILAIFLIIFALYFGLNLKKRLQHSIENLLTATKEFARGNLSFRAPILEADEIGLLTHEVNSMADSLQQSTVSRQQVENINVELMNANRELEAFSYSVSHDLRSPLRSIDGFSQALVEDFGSLLNAEGKDHLSRIRAAVQRMGRLIDDLLNLSRISRASMKPVMVDLSVLANEIITELKKFDPQNRIDFEVQPNLNTKADPSLMKIVLENLFNNAVKYSSKHATAKIQFGSVLKDGNTIFFIKDDGAGFNMEYSSKLFGAFQRLHTNSEFPGTGVGLATVQRIIHRHSGSIWAEGQVEKGATFYFTLGHQKNQWGL